MIKKANLYTLILFLLVSTACISNFIYFRNDNSILGCDSGNHLFFSIEFFYKISNIIHDTSRSVLIKIISIIRRIGEPVPYSTTYWPNGLNLIASLFYFMFGKSLFAAKLSLLPYLSILLFSTYFIGKSLSSKSVGLTGAFILFMYPLIFESSRQFQLDFPLTAMVTLNILLVLKSNCFQNRKYSLLLGLSLGYSMLVKGQTILFILWPLLFILYITFRSAGKKILKQHLKSIQLQNIILFLLLTASISSIWWAHQMPIVKASLIEHIFAAHKTIESGYTITEKYSLPIISFYIRNMFASLSPLLFLSFLASIFYFKKNVRFKMLYLSWLIIPFLLFSLVFSIKDIRFLMPILPVMALITAQGIKQINNKIIQTLTLTSIILFSSAQFFLFSYTDFAIKNVSLASIKIFTHNTGYANICHKDNTNTTIYRVIQTIKKHASLTSPVTIGFVNCENRSSFETLYFLKICSKNILPLDFLEMPTLFVKELPHMEYILFRQPTENSIKWPKGREIKNLLIQEGHTQRMAILKYFNQLSALLESLENIDSNFELINIIPSGKYEPYCYYVYKRMHLLKKIPSNITDALEKPGFET